MKLKFMGNDSANESMLGSLSLQEGASWKVKVFGVWFSFLLFPNTKPCKLNKDRAEDCWKENKFLKIHLMCELSSNKKLNFDIEK